MEELKEQGKEAIKIILKNSELTGEELVEKLYEPLMTAVAGKLKEVVPGKYDDVVIDILVPNLKPVLKAEILKVIEKISLEV